MAKKKPAKKTVKSKSSKLTKAKAPKKTKAKVSRVKKKAVTKPNYAEILPEMLQRIAKPKVREVGGIKQGVCELHIENVCMAPPMITFPAKNAPLRTYEFILNKSRLRVCMRCATHQEQTGAWDMEPIKGGSSTSNDPNYENTPK